MVANQREKNRSHAHAQLLTKKNTFALSACVYYPVALRVEIEGGPV
jgi:hypothetical protein